MRPCSRPALPGGCAPSRRPCCGRTAAAVAATATGALLLLDPEVASARDRGWRVPRRELARRLAVGLLFGLHTWRFRILLEPGAGHREDAASPPEGSGADVPATPAPVADGW